MVERSNGRPGTRADFAAFIEGFASLWVQVVLIRRLMATFSGNELTIGIVLSAWMVWTGLGTLLPARYSDRIKSPANALALVFIAAGLVLLPAVLFTAGIKAWLGVPRPELAGLPMVVLASFIITGPVCFLLGFAFNLAARMQEDFQVAAGRAYRFEALGAFAAGLVLAFWFGGKAFPVTPALFMAIILVTAGMALPERTRSRSWAYVLAAEFVVLAAFLAFGGRDKKGNVDQLYEKIFWKDRQVLCSFDSRYAYLAAVREGGETTIYEDGSPAATFPNPGATEVMAHLPLSMCNSPHRVLLIGGGFSGMAEKVLQHPIKSLEYVQIDPGWIRLEREHAHGFKDVISDPRVKVILGDGRAWLFENKRRYNAIIVNLSDPFTAALNRFYTAEFFEEVRDSLAKGGVLAVTAGITPDNLAYTRGQMGLLAGTVKTVRSVFPRLVVLPLHDNIIVAGDENSRLTTDPGRIQAVLQQRGVDTFYADKGMIAPNLVPGIISRVKKSIDNASVKIDRDLHPRGYMYAIMLWAERASPAVHKLIRVLSPDGLGLHPLWLALLPGLVLVTGVLAGQRSPVQSGAVLATGASGFAAIVIEVSAMISFQMLQGSVYFAMSLLTASFMAGLTAGAWVWERLRQKARLIRVQIALAAWSAIAMALVYAMTTGGLRGPAGTAGFCLVLLCQGAVAGALFPAAGEMLIRTGHEVGRGTGWINGAEHMGSALGGMLAGVALVPVFGVTGSMIEAALVAAAACAVTIVGEAFRSR